MHHSGGRSLFPGHQEPRQGQEAGRTGGGRSFRRGYKPTPSEASLFASPCAVARGRTCVPRPLFVVCSLAAFAVAPDLRLCSLAAVPTPTPTRAGGGSRDATGAAAGSEARGAQGCLVGGRHDVAPVACGGMHLTITNWRLLLKPPDEAT